MTIVDLTGMAIVEIRDFPAVTAIVGQKTRPEFATGEEPPAVIIEGLGVDYHPIPGASRARLQTELLIAKCYGTDRKQAFQLRNAVAEAIDLRGIRTSSGKLVFISLAESGADVELDPVTKWPHADLMFTYLGAQAAVP
jgi:hypothetical protein